MTRVLACPVLPKGSVIMLGSKHPAPVERVPGDTRAVATDEPWVAEGFGPVADAFRRNFADPGEDAAAVAVYHRGTRVVDLWGGTDLVRDRPMPADALMVVASCSKGVTATVLAVLVERGLLDPEERVSAYWPEFAANGKEHVTVGMVASHTAGLPFPPLGTGLTGLDLHRGPAVTRALAAAAPLWAPGTAMAYHPVTFGTLLDEIVRRATGSGIAAHVRRLLAEPLGAGPVDGPAAGAGRPGRARALGAEQPDGAGRGARRTRQRTRRCASSSCARTRRWIPTSPTRSLSARSTPPSDPPSAPSPTPARWPGCTPRPSARSTASG